INLLLDAIRKTIETASRAAHAQGWSEWRQWRHQMNCIRKAYRIIQKAKHSTAQDPDKRTAHEARTLEAYTAYLDLAEQHVTRATATANVLKEEGLLDIAQQIEGYLEHARRQ
ncbi:ISNCY family transposase, partial [Acidithiobacillus sp. MC6.1]|nr:ISNCY family transposase [Acidithiobacillus sp. MC6.1]